MSMKFPYSVELETKPDFEACMERVYAWYNHQVLDRVPVRFSAHNAEYNTVDRADRWPTLKDRWFDAEYQVDKYLNSIRGKKFLGESFPVYWPNLGPNVYPCMLGGEVEFGDVTTWARHTLHDYSEASRYRFDPRSPYFKKLDEMTDIALEKGKDLFITGYTDIHHGPDCADAIRGTEALCMDLYDEPEEAKAFIEQCSLDFERVFHYFNDKLRAHDQPSVTWINIPSYESFHIPGMDLSSMLSREQFREFVLPVLQREVKVARHNVLHMDGKGVARHLDDFLAIPELAGIQWVQGVAEDEPILQWVPLIQKIQNAGKGVVVDLKVEELEPFMDAVSPEGIYLCIASDDEEEQQAILKRLLKWK